MGASEHGGEHKGARVGARVCAGELSARARAGAWSSISSRLGVVCTGWKGGRGEGGCKWAWSGQRKKQRKGGVRV